MKLRKTDTKIDENKVREYHTLYYQNSSATEIATIMDELKIYQAILSRQLPSERYNEFLNFVYILLYPNATSEEIKIALVMCVCARENQIRKCHLQKI